MQAWLQRSVTGTGTHQGLLLLVALALRCRASSKQEAVLAQGGLAGCGLRALPAGISCQQPAVVHTTCKDVGELKQQSSYVAAAPPTSLEYHRWLGGGITITHQAAAMAPWYPETAKESEP